MESPSDVLYPADESFMPDMLCGKESPVHTLNGGTSTYEETGMEKLIEELDIPTLVRLFGQKQDIDRKRSNFQKNFGVACGQNVAPADSDEDNIKFSGCSLPRLNNDTKDTHVTAAFTAAWKIGRIMGIDYCQDNFLEINKWAVPHFDFVEHMMGKSGFAAMSLCLLKEDDDHRVSRHTDNENDPRLSAVLNVTEQIYRNGKWERWSGIFYMRKQLTT
jgi:hypothetical protein